jgi:hypothetical protein
MRIVLRELETQGVILEPVDNRRISFQLAIHPVQDTSEFDR